MLESIKKRAYEIEDELGKEIEEVCDFIFNNPELGNEEYISSKYLVDKMKEYGFDTIYPYCNMDTAFRAELGDNNGPTIAFLAEYDALPGYGENKEPAHACGHNWIAASTLGACIVLSKLKEKFKGKIVLIGTPAEESTGGKCDLVKGGVFDDIDVCYQMHIEAFNNINCKALAMDSIEFTFKGVAAHAASHPHVGVNALDAVQLTFAGINALRQHVKSDVRIHGIVSDGGEAANIVPEKASCKFYIRASERSYLNEVTKKVINCAKGAELMTGAKLTYRNFENPFDNVINNKVLQDITKNNLIKVGITDILEGKDGPVGSTDIGNVSQVCPTMYTEIALDINPMVYVHENEFLNYANSKEAYDKLHKSVKAMVGCALEIYLEDGLLDDIKKNHLNI
ncbi:amidohydrolase [Paeniclostridium sordellii]|uniref:M20 family metallopeptidase n=1 Tax=Paraclostridium sordellii TaxID=1505 RepID=UPI00054358D2|nr:M20 family metallopeptidase [Paeniclostridium sordellii]MDU4413166.1 M20 family metallopeptidase [Paeniclostridium sordellii]MRZ29450.1 amidohydrolase [Paeniclostridium sordellii]MVO73803.1 amidohydrolase [Paeniclostridium sordellii]CEK33842.1 amidohydrolase, M20D family,Aminobenzoyl-glutamate utilization protein B,succinyl-diaminopimelate desuccinylase,Metal-dependent amidase/aminoacylase/carboxypeptidase,amidohydrolase,Peptidase family M20/M25/M40 [[Clostridium] sordellii] [Paeniclostridiu